MSLRYFSSYTATFAGAYLGLLIYDWTRTMKANLVCLFGISISWSLL